MANEAHEGWIGLMSRSRGDSRKKTKELALFLTVFDTNRFDYTESERPDFLLKRTGSEEWSYGVEITELFASESDARLMNVPGYFDDILAGKISRKGSPYRHADDVQELPVQSVTVLDKDGNVKHEGLRVIFREQNPEDLHGRKLAARIIDKNTLAPDYLKQVARVDLLVYDWIEHGPLVGESHDVGELLVEELRDALNESPFGEVYLVATTKNDNQVYRPLRLLSLLEAAFVFTRSFDDTAEIVQSLDHVEMTRLFAHAARARGLRIGFACGDDSFVTYGGAGVRFTETGIELIEFEAELPETADELPTAPLDRTRLASIIDSYMRTSRRARFQSGLVASACVPIGVTMGWKSAAQNDERQ
ncbi:hypothetical protein ACWZHB_10795 [Nocardia sp. FBN12]|uniref:hypothetical protein n=1 Tax=Nocardia sp. FBN12 TaxID=3419766 RepID=UPI003D039771